MPNISDLVRDRNPLTLKPDASVQHACERMRESRAGAVLVVSSDGELLGIFTRGDAINRVLAQGKAAHETTLGQVMTAQPRTVPPNTSVIDALRIMSDRGCRHLPVLAEGRVVGLVFRGDFRGRDLDRIEDEAVLWERI